jgi:two-component system nitrate/nitrite response regulator NarL
VSRWTRTIFVDQNQLFREGLRRILSETDFRVARDSATLEEVLKGIPDKMAPHLLLLSVGSDYVTAAREVEHFKGIYASARVVVLSEHCNFDSVFAVLRAGANGFVLKRIHHKTLLKSLELVMLGQSVIPSMVIDLFTGPLKPPFGTQVLIEGWKSGFSRIETDRDDFSRKFSSREAEILDCLTRGEANKLIARQFDIAEATVKVHVKAILRKIGVGNRTQAAIWAKHHLTAPGNSASMVSESTTDPSRDLPREELVLE